MNETAILGYNRATIRKAGTTVALVAGLSMLYVHPRLAEFGTAARWSSLAIHFVAVIFVVYSLVLDIRSWRESDRGTDP